MNGSRDMGIAGLLVALLLGGVSEPASASELVDQLLAKLDQAEKAWNLAHLANYSYSLVDGGVFGYVKYRIAVNNGKCVATSKLSRHRAWRPDSCEGHSIAEIFTDVRRQLARGF